LRGAERARFDCVGSLCAFVQAGEVARFGISFPYDCLSGVELALLGPLPSDTKYSEWVRFTGRQPPARPAKPLVPGPDVDAFVAHVFTADAWRVCSRWWTQQPFGRSELSFRVQHDEGTGPAAFVDWQVEPIVAALFEPGGHIPEQRVRGWTGEIEALFVGSENDVRAAIGRLSEWLLPHGWTRAERSGRVSRALGR